MRKVSFLGVLFEAESFDGLENKMIDRRSVAGKAFSGTIEVLPTGSFKEATLLFESSGALKVSGRLKRRRVRFSFPFNLGKETHLVVVELRQGRGGGGYWGYWHHDNVRPYEKCLACCCVKPVEE